MKQKLKKLQFNKESLPNILLPIIAYIIATLAIAGGAYFGAGLAVTVDMPAFDRIRAPHVMENLAQTEKNRQAALEFAQNLEQVYTINPEEWQFVDLNLSLLQQDIQNIRDHHTQEIETYTQAHEDWETEVDNINIQIKTAIAQWENARAIAIVNEQPEPPPPITPTLPTEPLPEHTYRQLFAGLHMLFTDEEEDLLVGLADDDFGQVWQALTEAAHTVQLTHEIDEVDFVTERAIMHTLDAIGGLDRPRASLAERIILQHLRPNTVPDYERNQERFYEHSNNYDRAWIQSGQIIVDEGEIVTQEIYNILAQLGMLRSDSIMENIVPFLGVMLLVLGIFVISIMYIILYYPHILTSRKEAFLLFTIFTLTIILAWGLRSFDIPVVALMVFPMLVSMLMERRTAMVLTIAMVLISFFIMEGNVEFLLLYIPAGALICLFSRFATERNKVIMVGLLIAATMFALSIATALIIERSHAVQEYQSLLLTGGIAATSGLLMVIATTGSLPLWESVFGVVTPVKLLDLTNPTNPLLRRLTIEAPGTYHHSLVVANLAEAAAFDIDANSHAARVGGYYHDIGKLKSPQFFAENIDGENPHDRLPPTHSAEIIIGHVTYGLDLAKEHRLPQFVRDIIAEHHGTTILQFFYAKAKTAAAEGADATEIDDTPYRYHFAAPTTKESACVMLADSVEAAVRATMPKLNSVDDVRDVIKKIVQSKLNGGQLLNSQLSIKDVSIVEESFFRVLKGMYHERIVYPK